MYYCVIILNTCFSGLKKKGMALVFVGVCVLVLTHGYFTGLKIGFICTQSPLPIGCVLNGPLIF